MLRVKSVQDDFAKYKIINTLDNSEGWTLPSKNVRVDPCRSDPKIKTKNRTDQVTTRAGSINFFQTRKSIQAIKNAPAKPISPNNACLDT